MFAMPLCLFFIYHAEESGTKWIEKSLLIKGARSISKGLLLCRRFTGFGAEFPDYINNTRIFK